MIFEQGDSPAQKTGTVIGAAFTIVVYVLLAWTVLHAIMH